MSQARKERRDEQRGGKIVRRIVLTITMQPGKPGALLDINHVGTPSGVVAARLREAADALEKRLAEKATAIENVVFAGESR